MKKILFIIIAAGFLFSFSVAFAQNEELGVAGGVNPSSPFYFFDALGEWLAVRLTFNPVKKVELKLKHAGERLAELKDIEEKGALTDKRTEKLKNSYEKIMQNSETDIDFLQGQGRDVSALVKKMEDLTARHTAVLERVLEKVPEQAKAAIERALEVSKRGHERAIEAIQKEMEGGKIKAEELKEEVREKVKEMKEKKSREKSGILEELDLEKEQAEIEDLTGDLDKNGLDDIGGDISDLEKLVQ